MDFGNAALLIAVVFAATEFVKKVLANVTLPTWLIQLIPVGLSLGAVFLVADSVWAHEQVIGGQALDSLDTGSKLLVGLMLGLGANFLHTAVNAVKNVGENNPDAGA